MLAIIKNPKSPKVSTIEVADEASFTQLLGNAVIKEVAFTPVSGVVVIAPKFSYDNQPKDLVDGSYNFSITAGFGVEEAEDDEPIFGKAIFLRKVKGQYESLTAEDVITLTDGFMPSGVNSMEEIYAILEKEGMEGLFVWATSKGFIKKNSGKADFANMTIHPASVTHIAESVAIHYEKEKGADIPVPFLAQRLRGIFADYDMAARPDVWVMKVAV